MQSKKFTLKILSITVLGLSLAVQSFGQSLAGPGAQVEQPDQIDRLAEMIGLSDEQEKEIRAVIAKNEPEIENLQAEAVGLQEELAELAGPDFDEEAIRSKAAVLGQLQGKMTASSIILQSKIDAIFTQEQREELETMQRQQQEMQQQMQQQQMQRQIQQMQMQQQQEPGTVPEQ